MADFHTAPKSCASLCLFPCTAQLAVPTPFPDESAAAVLSYGHLSVVELNIVITVGALLSTIYASTLPKLVVERRWAARRIDLWDLCGCAAVW